MRTLWFSLSQQQWQPMPTVTCDRVISLSAEEDKHAQVPELSRLPMSGALGMSAPVLAKGADNIYWVHQLHEALTAHGYYPDDDEAADWFFGDHTASAVTAFQACTLWLGDARCACCLQLHHRCACCHSVLPQHSFKQGLSAPGRQGAA